MKRRAAGSWPTASRRLPTSGRISSNGIHGQILVGSILSGVGAYLSLRFLMKYFRSNTLYPFAIYCFVVGLGSVIYLAVR